MKSKGFTMVELLVALGISSIVVGVIFTFFMSSYKSYKSVRNNTEMQFQAQYILNFMGEKIMNSNSMSLARVGTTNYTMTTVRSAGTEYQVDKIFFKFGRESENYVFQIRNKNISYGECNWEEIKEKEATSEFGNYVNGMYVSVLKDESFQNAKAIKLKIVMKKDEQTYDAFQAIYMRNN